MAFVPLTACAILIVCVAKLSQAITFFCKYQCDIPPIHLHTRKACALVYVMKTTVWIVAWTSIYERIDVLIRSKRVAIQLCIVPKSQQHLIRFALNALIVSFVRAKVITRVYLDQRKCREPIRCWLFDIQWNCFETIVQLSTAIRIYQSLAIMCSEDENLNSESDLVILGELTEYENAVCTHLFYNETTWVYKKTHKYIKKMLYFRCGDSQTQNDVPFDRAACFLVREPWT